MGKKILEKFKNFKHKEIVFIVIIIVLIAICFISASKSSQTNSINTTGMSAKEKLTYEVSQAVSAISGDENSKIIIVWETLENEEKEQSGLSGLFNSKTEENSYPKVKGVAVVCENGNDAKTKVEITMMLSKIFGISVDNISINAKK